MNVIGYGTIMIKISGGLSFICWKVFTFQLESIHNRTNVFEADIISASLASA